MSDFIPAVEFILKPGHEGGLVEDPGDPGGLTNFGISQRSYPHLDIRNLTRDQAIGIYLRDFWHLGDLRSQEAANKVFDMQVNFGMTGGTRLFQQALIYFKVLTVCDGVIGPGTISGANKVMDAMLVPELKVRAAKAHCDVAIARPAEAHDLLGWLRRDVDG
jgi:lysozyme family protein